MNLTTENLEARRESLIEDIARMPFALHGTEWHNDRIAELKWLVKAIDRAAAAGR